MTITLTLTPDLEAQVTRRAQEQGETPENLVLEHLRHSFSEAPRTYAVKTLTPPPAMPIPYEEWVQLLRSAGSDCGVSLTDEQVSRDSLYDYHL
jgi:hypothetical protein